VRDLARDKKNYEHLIRLENATDNLEIVESDLLDADSWGKAFEGAQHS
jgi:uncharacterized protein YbjT (DUF2867 family)